VKEMISTNNLLPCIEVTPGTQPIGTVILLHGLGADGNDFVPLVPELQLPLNIPLRFVFPNAPLKPVTINNGYIMPAWYDILSMDINQRADKTGIVESVKELEKIIEHEEKLGIPTEKIVLAGFSQGAVIALLTGLSFSRRLAGILAMSGYLPHPSIDLNDANRNTPIFMAHGRQDAVIPYQVGLSSHDALNNLGISASWHSYQMAHSVCEKEINDISTWLCEIYK
jgi:phospholipase/carboxylesterase